MANTMNQPQNLRDKAAEAGSALADRAKDAAAGAADKAKDAASSFVDKAKGAASTVADSASEIAQSVAAKSKQVTTAVGTGLKNVAETIRDHTPQKGVLHSASTTIADSIESGGDYLKEKGLPGIAADVTDLIRRNPIPALLLGIGIGFLMARSLRS
jgi:hypothetical protein